MILYGCGIVFVDQLNPVACLLKSKVLLLSMQSLNHHRLSSNSLCLLGHHELVVPFFISSMSVRV